MFNTIFSHEVFERFVTEVRTPSLIMDFGTPDLEKMFAFKNLSTTLWSLVLQGIASTHLDT